jgi:hypothetical protein
MQFDLVETILVRELKPEDWRRYVAGRLYRDFITGINISESERLGQEAATGSPSLILSSSGSEAPSAKVV